MSGSNIRLAFVAALILAGCSSTPQVTELPSTADPQQEISRMEDGLKQAQDRQANVLAPNSFEKAQEYLDKAREARSNNKDQKYVLYQIAVSQAYLDKANHVVTIATPSLQVVMVKRQDAINAHAPQLFTEEFNSAEDDLKEVGNQLESNDLSGAEKSRSKLESQYASLEVDAIKKAKLSAAKEDIMQALREGAKKFTPNTLAWAQSQVDKDEATIVNNLHNPAVVDTAAADATAAGNRLLMMVRQAKNEIQKTPEELASQAEQTQTAEAAAQQKIDQEAARVAALAAEKNKINDHLQTTKEELDAATRAEAQYDAAQKAFTTDEALVYKQGDKIVLRLKGLNFPTNKAVITPDNYPLLAKVQKLMKEAGADSVITVEGHTDSTGSPQHNTKLSQERADAVKSYLVSNNSVEDDKIKAVGFGEAQPIASNKTHDGRAINRRVDVIISSGPTVDNAGAEAYEH